MFPVCFQPQGVARQNEQPAGSYCSAAWFSIFLPKPTGPTPFPGPHKVYCVASIYPKEGGDNNHESAPGVKLGHKMILSLDL